jgi:hypothetical protein
MDQTYRRLNKAAMSNFEYTISKSTFVRSQVHYAVKDPKHETEKPYELRYDAGNKVPQTNVIFEAKDVAICKFSEAANIDCFERYGVVLTKLTSPLAASEYRDDKKVEAIFYPVVEEMLRRRFPDAAEIRLLEHGVSMIHGVGESASPLTSSVPKEACRLPGVCRHSPACATCNIGSYWSVEDGMRWYAR